jgi:hypothetical protein
VKTFLGVAATIIAVIALFALMQWGYDGECETLFRAARTHADTIVIASSRPGMYASTCGVPK